MSFKHIRTVALTSAIAMGAVIASTSFADAHRWCGRHHAWHHKGTHYGWNHGWRSQRYVRAYRPAYYGMGTPSTYGYSSPYSGAYSTPGYYGYGGNCGGGGMFGGSGLFGLGTGIL